MGLRSAQCGVSIGIAACGILLLWKMFSPEWWEEHRNLSLSQLE